MRVAASMQSAVVGGAHVTAARRVQGHTAEDRVLVYSLPHIITF